MTRYFLIMFVVACGMSCQSSPRKQAARALSPLTRHSEVPSIPGARKIIFYIQQFRVDYSGYGVRAESLVKNILTSCEPTDISVVLWPSSVNEKVEGWYGEEATKIAATLANVMGGASLGSEPGAFAVGLGYCLRIAEGDAEIVIISNEDGVANFRDQEYKALAWASRDRVVHVVWYGGQDSRVVTPFISGELVIITNGNVSVERCKFGSNDHTQSAQGRSRPQ